MLICRNEISICIRHEHLSNVMCIEGEKLRWVMKIQRKTDAHTIDCYENGEKMFSLQKQFKWIFFMNVREKTIEIGYIRFFVRSLIRSIFFSEFLKKTIISRLIWPFVLNIRSFVHRRI